jgi:hypothetical protein
MGNTAKTKGNTEDEGQYRRRAILTMVATTHSTAKTMGNTDEEQYHWRWAILATMGTTIDDQQYPGYL